MYINEDLTQKNQEILYLSRQLKTKKKIANVWSRDGHIFIKVDEHDKPTEIKSKECLLKYSNALNISSTETDNLIDGKQSPRPTPRTSSPNEIEKMAASVLNFTFQSPKPKGPRSIQASNETISSYRDQSLMSDPEAKSPRGTTSNQKSQKLINKPGPSSAV